MRTDLTRVMTLMHADSGSSRWFDFLNVRDTHHELSHNTQPNAIEQLTAIDTWEVQQFATLLQRMRDVDEGDGATLLDRSAVYFSSEVSNGAQHLATNLPVLLAGRCGGAFQPGRHVACAQGQPVSSLFLAILDALGVPSRTFGDDGTAALTGLA